MKKTNVSRAVALVAASAFASIANAAPITFDVDAIDSIYNANDPNASGSGAAGPVGFVLAPNAVSFTLQINTVNGLTFNSGGNINDADGVGAAVA